MAFNHFQAFEPFKAFRQEPPGPFIPADCDPFTVSDGAGGCEPFLVSDGEGGCTPFLVREG